MLLGALCALAIIASRWGYALIVPPHTPVYANFDIGFQYLYADYFRDHGSLPSAPADISHGAVDGYFWWWWNNDYFAQYLGLAAALVGVPMRLGLSFVTSYALVTWIADLCIAVLAYRLVRRVSGHWAAAVAASLVAVHPLFVWGMYQAQVQISVGTAATLGVIECWYYWNELRSRTALVLAAVLALVASHAHAFFLTALLVLVLPAVAAAALKLGERAFLSRQLVFGTMTIIGLLLNTRFWSNFGMYSAVTRSMIGRKDSWGELPSPLFLAGFASDTGAWEWSLRWVALTAFVLAAVGGVLYSYRLQFTGKMATPLAMLLGGLFGLDVLSNVVAHYVDYNYWILRHAQFHVVTAVLAASIGLGALQRTGRARRGAAWLLAASFITLLCSISIAAVRVPRSHGAAYAEFLRDSSRFPLPYLLLLYPGGTALTSFTCAVTERPTYDSSNTQILLEHLQRYYDWTPGQEVNVLWYSKASDVARSEIPFTTILGEWSADGETVVLGRARLQLQGLRAPQVTDTTGLLLTDQLDVGDERDEAVHAYQTDGMANVPATGVYTSAHGSVVFEQGRRAKSREEFRMRVAPRNDHALVMALGTTKDEQVRLSVDGKVASVVALEDRAPGPQEVVLPIDGTLIGGNREVTLQLEYLGGAHEDSFRYWMFSRQNLPGLPHPLITDVSGLTEVDRLDVGDPRSEQAHDYVIEQPTFDGFQQFDFEDLDASYIETGRATRRFESFKLDVLPGEEHVLVKAFDNHSRGQKLHVTVDGKSLDQWEMPSGSQRYGEASLTIPAALTTSSDRIKLVVEFVDGSVDQNSFMYWLYAK
jgi:hypothetical protein